MTSSRSPTAGRYQTGDGDGASELMLPARVAIDPRESQLICTLERIALQNDLTTRVLSACSKENRDGSSISTAFMLVRPSDGALSAE